MSALDEQLLNEESALAAADTSGVLRALAGAGAQVRRAVTLTRESVPARWAAMDRPRAVVVAGRGSSLIVADALAAVMGATGPVPVVSLSGGVLPSWVGALDLVIPVSLSGSATGAVSIAAEAARRGASLLTIGTESSPLGQISEQHRGAHVALPQGTTSATPLVTTRTALWAMLTPALLVTADLGLMGGNIDASDSGLMAIADTLDDEAEVCRPGSESFVNPAKSLALELDASVPVVLGNGPMGHVAARRASSALARTARLPAAFGGLPDDAGDVVATFGGPLVAGTEDIFADPYEDGPAAARLRLLLLELEDDRTTHVVSDLADRSGVRVSRVAADGPTSLQRFAQVVSRVDFAATYLGLATGCDPARSPQVADLRDALR